MSFRILFFLRMLIPLGVALTVNDAALAQKPGFNLDIRSGLPSNQVYRVLSDHYGYLWIATADGLVKYNGYSTKVFDISAGMDNDDVWNVFEDKKGRIWPVSVSNNMGYIYGDVYRRIFVDDPRYIYPANFVDHKTGIAFISGNVRNTKTVCFEKNDSLTTFELTPYEHYGITAGGELLRQNINGDVLRIVPSRLFSTKKIANNKLQNGNLFGNYLFPPRKANATDTFIQLINIDNGTKKYIPIARDEQIVVTLQYNDHYYISTNRSVYKIDRNLKSEVLRLPLTGHSNSTIFTTVVDDKLWGRCAATANAGLYIDLPAYQFQKADQMLADYNYVGMSADSTRYLWSTRNKRLAIVDKTNKTHFLAMPDVHEVKNISPLSLKESVLRTDREIFLFSGNTYKVLYRTDLKVFNDSAGTVTYIGTAETWRETSYNDCIADSNHTLHIAHTGYGFSILYLQGDTLKKKKLDDDRYIGVIRYPFTRSYIAYGRNNLLVYNDKLSLKIDRATLARLGITNIKKVFTDSNGTIIIHTDDKLLMYDIARHRCVSLFANYKLNNARVFLHGDRMIAAGGFGVAFTHIPKTTLPSPTRILVNFKNSYYHEIRDAYITDALYMNTDMGLYRVPLDEHTEQVAFNNFKPHCGLYVSSTVYHGIVSSGDTILLNQSAPFASFDFINPYGSGSAKYHYTIQGEGAAVSYASQQLSLPVLKPGTYYTLSLNVIDDLWKSNKYTLHIRVIPLWWQTASGKRLLYLLAILTLTLLSVTATVVTLRILTRKHTKQNRYRELELKSIYAQLNPHFIFNTLGNIIYFVRHNRNKEADKHLTVFSKLLRSYIKSSRNRLLTLEEEAENLDNYILLQRSRFEDKFDYTISISDTLNTKSTYVPALLLQPIVENAINHGLQPKQEQGNLTITFKEGEEPDTLTIIVDDDGIGRTKAKEQKSSDASKTESYGVSLLEDLVSIFAHYELFKVGIKYIDKELPLTGTTVIITIKYKS